MALGIESKPLVAAFAFMVALVSSTSLARAQGDAPPVDAPFRRFYRRIIDFNPLPLLPRLSIPSLWLLGSHDAEMPFAETATVLLRLKAEGKPVTVRIFEGADHSLFINGTGPAFQWPRVVTGYPDAFIDWVTAATQKAN